MTTVAAWESGPITSAAVAEDDPDTSMPRNVRVTNRLWWAFTNAVGERRKSEWVVPYIEAIVSDPKLFQEFRALAKIRGDSFSEALVKALSKYNAER